MTQYAKQTWIDGNAAYPASAARLSHIEDGIAAALTYANAPVATPADIQTVADPSGVWPNGVVFGNQVSYGYSGLGSPAGVYAPGPSYNHRMQAAGGPGAAITKSIQGMFGNIQFAGPTTDDSAQSANHGVFMKDPVALGGTAYTQTQPVVAHEADVQIENHVTVSGAYMLGHGSRLTVMNGGTITNSPAYGFKASGWASNNKGAITYGAMSSWRGFYDDLYNPAGTAFDSSFSFYGLNQIVSEQGVKLTRTSYGGALTAQLHGSAYNGSLMIISLPNPSTTTSVADGVFTSGSNLMTTFTAPTAAWIGRVIANANVPTGTQVLNYYGSSPYTIVMNDNATGTVSSQTVTFTEPDLTGLRINMASGQSTGNALDVRDTGGNQRWVVSRAGIPRSVGIQTQVANGSSQAVVQLNQDGSIQPGTNRSSTGVLGARIWAGTGVPGTASPTYPGGAVTPAAGDWFMRTDTPSSANQRLYVCTTGGSAPVWSGVV